MCCVANDGIHKHSIEFQCVLWRHKGFVNDFIIKNICRRRIPFADDFAALLLFLIIVPGIGLVCQIGMSNWKGWSHGDEIG